MANVLICLSASKYNSRVIDKGAQIAKSNHAVLSAIFVQTPKYEGASAASKSCLRENIKYAESKGAKVTILYGQDVLPQLVEYVGVSQVDCVVLEKNLAKQALFKLKDIDIYSVNYPQDYRRHVFYFNFNLFEFFIERYIKNDGDSFSLYAYWQGIYALSIFDYNAYYDLYLGHCICIHLDKWIYL